MDQGLKRRAPRASSGRINADQQNRVRASKVSVIVQGGGRRIAGRHRVIVSPGSIPVQRKRSTEWNSQKRRVAFAGRRQFYEVDKPCDRAGTGKRVLPSEVLLETQRQVDSAPIKDVIPRQTGSRECTGLREHAAVANHAVARVLN